MNELALFAGAGGGILGGHLLGWRTVCAVEWEQYPACVLAARQNDGLLPPQCSLFEDLTKSLQTWPRWGSMQNGVCWEQPMLEQITKGTEFGLSEKMPTPNSWDAKRGPMSKELMETGKHQVSLVTYVKHNPKKWGTPKAQDSRHALRDRGKGNLGEQVSGLHNGGKLNPLWTEWLMGWLIGWTDLKPLEMDKSLYVQQQPGNF